MEAVKVEGVWKLDLFLKNTKQEKMWKREWECEGGNGGKVSFPRLLISDKQGMEKKIHNLGR